MMIMDALKNDDAHAMHMLDATITLGCYTLYPFLIQISYHYLVVELGSSRCLAML